MVTPRLIKTSRTGTQMSPWYAGTSLAATMPTMPKSSTTVIKAITLAGGFSDTAAPSKVKIVRKEQEREKVLEAVKMDQLVLPEDVIVVPESFF